MMILKPMHVSGHVRRWQCGHPRTAETIYWNNGSSPQCAICRREYALAQRTAFSCGHPTSAENVLLRGKKRRCKLCQQASQKRSKERSQKAYPMPPCLLQAHWTTAVLPVED